MVTSILSKICYVLVLLTIQLAAATKTTVHLIAHSHDDVGWKMTYTNYYNYEVNSILTTVFKALKISKRRKFTYVELKFFAMWWEKQDFETKERFKQMILDGQAEFVNGSWSMEDEACPTFTDMIENFTIGQAFLLKEFGDCCRDKIVPKIGWQLDPFGHSNANARLYAEMGFSATF